MARLNESLSVTPYFGAGQNVGKIDHLDQIIG